MNNMEFYDISNLDIKMIYAINADQKSKKWMHEVFVQTKFFAEYRAKKYKNNLLKSDLNQEAYLGLWEAILTYDYQKNFDFYRWAQWNISKKLRNFNLNTKRFLKARSSIKDKLSNGDLGSSIYCQDVELETKVVLSKLFLEKNIFLSKRERQIIVENLIVGKNLKEIAKDFGLSAERIRQIKDSGLEKSKDVLS